MKKSMYLAACLVAVIFIHIYNVKADTLDAVLNDVVNDVIVTEKNGTCKANPYLLTKSGKHAVASCNPVVAQCPAGATLIPLSKCTLRSSTADATILTMLKQVQPLSTDLGDPLETEKLNKTGLQCNLDAGKFSVSNSFGVDFFIYVGVGYSPFCFFDLSKVETIPIGGKRWAKPYYIRDDLVYMSNGSTITPSELNNPANWKCYSGLFKATARCITLPAGFLDKLGIK